MNLSIVVPAKNESAALKPTLQALAKQRARDDELIAACNGCTDDTAAQAATVAGVKVIETEKSGMSYGKNFGAAAASGQTLVFVDADTLLPPGALDILRAKAADAPGAYVATVAGKPDRGGGVVRGCFWLANCFTRLKQVHAPGGVMMMPRDFFQQLAGFAEDLPQGTSSDFIMRAKAAGGRYLFIKQFKAITSIRRFEKTGIIPQMLAWRQNHRQLASGQREAVRQKDYADIR